MSGSPHGVFGGSQFFATRPAMNALTTSAFGRSPEVADSPADTGGSSMFRCARVTDVTAMSPPPTTIAAASQGNALRVMTLKASLLSGRLRRRPFGRHHFRRNRRFRHFGKAPVQRLFGELHTAVLDHLRLRI